MRGGSLHIFSSLVRGVRFTEKKDMRGGSLHIFSSLVRGLGLLRKRI